MTESCKTNKTKQNKTKQNKAAVMLHPSAQTAGDFRQSLAFLHVSHLPLLYILVLEVGYIFCTHSPQVCLGCLRDTAPMPISALRQHPVPKLQGISVSRWRFCMLAEKPQATFGSPSAM